MTADGTAAPRCAIPWCSLPPALSCTPHRTLRRHPLPPGKEPAAPSAHPSPVLQGRSQRGGRVAAFPTVTLVPFSLQQVKTVRFQNHSPPPPKRHSLQPSPSLPRSRTEPAAAAEALLPEASLPGPELAVLYSPRTSSSPLHQRRALHPKALTLDLSGQLTFPVKKNYSSVSAN